MSTARGGIYYTIKHCAIVVPLLRQSDMRDLVHDIRFLSHLPVDPSFVERLLIHILDLGPSANTLDMLHNFPQAQRPPCLESKLKDTFSLGCSDAEGHCFVLRFPD